MSTPARFAIGAIAVCALSWAALGYGVISWLINRPEHETTGKDTA